MDINYNFIAIATLGAAVQEIAHWFELRSKLNEDKLKAMLKSKGFWLITVLMILVSGPSLFILFGEKATKPNMQFILGAAFPLIFKKIVAAIGKKDEILLGENALRDYFLLYTIK